MGHSDKQKGAVWSCFSPFHGKNHAKMVHRLQPIPFSAMVFSAAFRFKARDDIARNTVNGGEKRFTSVFSMLKLPRLEQQRNCIAEASDDGK